MTTSTVNHQVIQHLLGSGHPDLKYGGVTAGLVAIAAEEVAGQLLDFGFRLHSAFQDGLAVVQNYYEPRSGAYIPDVGLSIGIFECKGSPTLKVMLRLAPPSADMPPGPDGLFDPAIRVRRVWFMPLNDAARPSDLVEYLRKFPGQSLRAAA
ncbi:hypothetical protein D3C78_836370 [compost metagenome]